MSAKQYDLFISYQNEDEGWVRALAAKLREAGVQVAPVKLSAGTLTASGLESAIRASRAGAVVISHGTATSRWVELEVNLLLSLWADRRLLGVLPILRSPTAPIPWMLAGFVRVQLDPAATVAQAGCELLHHLKAMDACKGSGPFQGDAVAATAPQIGREPMPPIVGLPRTVAPHRQIDVVIGAGSLTFFALRDEKEPSVALAPTPLTWGQLRALYPQRRLAGEGASLPVTRIMPEEAAEICRDLSSRTRRRIRLPSPSEWERAYRAGTCTPYFFGRSPAALSEYAHVGALTPAPVGARLPNPWGFFDLAGNVWEICLEEQEPALCIARGGCFLSPPEHCAATYWIPCESRQASRQVGVRLALELKN